MATDDPVGDVVRLRVLGHSYADIQEHLEAQGFTVTESRVKQIVNRIGEGTFQWIREEYLDEAASTILEYKSVIRDMHEQFNRRFVEAQRQYDEYQEHKDATLASLFEQYRHEKDPDPQKYARRAYALCEGQDLKDLANIMKKLSSEMNRWTEFGAKLDKQLAQEGVNINEVKIERSVQQIYSQLCENCRADLAEMSEADGELIQP